MQIFFCNSSSKQKSGVRIKDKMMIAIAKKYLNFIKKLTRSFKRYFINYTSKIIYKVIIVCLRARFSRKLVF